MALIDKASQFTWKSRRQTKGADAIGAIRVTNASSYRFILESVDLGT